MDWWKTGDSEKINWNHLPMNQIIILLCIILSVFNGLAQVTDTIYGRVFSSITKERPAGDILITEKGTGRIILADSLGEFKLVPKVKKETYKLLIIAGYHDLLEYDYKSEWTQRSGPESIVVWAVCNKEEFAKNLKKKDVKPIIWYGFGRMDRDLSQEDKRFEKKYKVNYVDLNIIRIPIECAERFNRGVFLELDLKHGVSWRKKINYSVIGRPYED